MSNQNDLSLFLEFVYGSSWKSKVICCSLLDKESKKVIEGLGTFFATGSELIESIDDLESKGTLHVVVNETNERGRKKDDIVAPGRVLLIDLDRMVDKEFLKEVISDFRVSLVIESSPGRYHLYIRCEIFDLKQWSKYQIALAYKVHGDLALGDIHHTIRVPGVERKCKDGAIFTPIVVYSLENPWIATDNNIVEILPDVQQSYESALKAKKDSFKAIKVGISKGKRVNVGSRNNTLYEYVNEEVFKRSCTEEEALELGLAFNNGFIDPLSEDEAIQTIKSAWKKASEGRVKFDEKKKVEGDSILEERLKGHSGFEYDLKAYTEAAMSERISQRFGHCMIRTSDCIYAFDITVGIWRKQLRSKEVLATFVKAAIKDATHEEEFLRQFCTDKKGSICLDKINQQDMLWNSTTKLFSLLKYLETQGNIKRMELSQFDANRELFHMSNGLFNLIDHTFRKEIKAEDYLLNKSRLEFRMNGRTLSEGEIDEGVKWWETFLQEVFNDNEEPEEMILLLQEIFGYCLTGRIDDQKIFVHIGEGSNGKSKILFALTQIMGSYAGSLDSTKLTKTEKAFTQEFNRIAVSFENKRVILVDDIDSISHWNEGYVKMLTAKELQVRRLYEEELITPNKCKIHIACNKAPSITPANEPMTRRLQFLPYNRQFKPDMGKEIEISENIEKYVFSMFLWSLDGLKRVRQNAFKFRVVAECERLKEQYTEHYSDSKTDEIVETVFKRGESDSDWHPIEKLVSHINGVIKAQFGEHARLKLYSSLSLGKVLKSKMQFENTRHREKGEKQTFYHVKLCSFNQGKLLI